VKKEGEKNLKNSSQSNDNGSANEISEGAQGGMYTPWQEKQEQQGTTKKK